MFGLTQVTGMICLKGKLKTISNFITEKRNTRLIEISFQLSYYKQA